MCTYGHTRAGKDKLEFVKIETDVGIYGLGEASLQYKDEGLLAEFEAFQRFLIGKNPFEIERISTSLLSACHMVGRTGDNKCDQRY